ncbi:hypothetical protein DB347_04620 [Opitutaceae bacterium EW11]|nr:hypothetical protein DB347_04620 [Opitutaceae bacterium EW11]
MSRALSLDAADDGPESRRSAGPHRLRIWAIVVAAAVFALVVLARWIVSPLATEAINRKLAHLPGYHGRVDTLRISLWRGAVGADGFQLFETGKERHGPVVKFKEVDLRLSWSALFRGKLGGRMIIDRPEIDIQKTETASPENKRKAAAKMREIQSKMEPWQEALRTAIPLEVTRLEVNDGRVHFSDTSHRPVAEFALDRVHLLLTGLKNREGGQRLPARLDLSAVTSGNGRLDVHVQADPLAEAPRFATTMKIQHLDLTGMNAFLAAYSEVKVSKGTFEIYVEANADNGTYQGYAKPFFKDLDFKSAKDNLGTKIKEAAAEAANAILKNDRDKKVATKAPFSGTFSGNKVDVWTAADLLLRNAFVEALREGFDR